MTSQALDTHIEMWPIARLIPYARNPRRNDAAVDRMAASIREYGFKIPVLVRSSGEVVDGHLRLKAAKKLGITEIPVILCDEWSEAQVKAFRLMVNRSVGWAHFTMLGCPMTSQRMNSLRKRSFAKQKHINNRLSLLGLSNSHIMKLVQFS
jgi:hypothetical protein